ncbi:MAG: hypothetical protein V7K40_13450 [Nostoc sp.]
MTLPRLNKFRLSNDTLRERSLMQHRFFFPSKNFWTIHTYNSTISDRHCDRFADRASRPIA